MTRLAFPLWLAVAAVVISGDLISAHFTSGGGPADPAKPPIPSRLDLEITRKDTGKATPARIYLFRDGEPFRLDPVDVLLPLRVDRFYRERLWRRDLPAGTAPRTLEVTHGGESHFILLDGRGAYDLPAGEYRIEAYRGFSWKPATASFRLEPGKPTAISLSLEPIGPGDDGLDPGRGWLSGDDHIHLTRAAEDDSIFVRWLEAEDLSVGNFLQLQRQVDAAVQHAFGPEGEAKSPGFSVRSGHESRSEFYGHVNLLGPTRLIRPLSIGTMYANSPEAYPFPKIIFQEGRQLGATVGYAHFDGSMRRSALPMDLALGTIDFIEVFQFGILKAEPWYELLNAGFRATGVAGSDFPANLPRFLPWPRTIPLLGPERTLVKDREAAADASQPGRSAYERWAEGVRAGRAMVTNGPLLDLTVDGKEPGSIIAWDGASTVVRGIARAVFHRPIEAIEIVVNGKVVSSQAGKEGQTRLTLPFEIPATGSVWVAARARCRKRAADPKEGVEPEIQAHTNPVYVLKNRQPVHIKEARDAVAARWERDAAYYRSGSLTFARPEERQELEALIDETTRILRAAPDPWK